MSFLKTPKLRFAAATLAISTAVFLAGCEDDRSAGAGNSSSGGRSSNLGISGNPTFNPDTVADLVSVYFKGMDTIAEYSGHVVSTHQKSQAHALSMVKACTTGIMKRKDQQESQQMEDFSCASFAEFVSSGQSTHVVDILYTEMLGLIDRNVVVGASETEAAVEYHQWQDSANTTLGTHSFNASGRILREWESSFQGDFQTPVDFSHVQSKSIDDFGTLRDAYLNTSYTSNFADGVSIFPSPTQQNFFYINGISTETRVTDYDADAGSCSFVFNSNHDTKFIPENMPDIENDFEFVQNQFYTCSCSSDGSGKISPDTCSEAENSRSINISGGDTVGISGTSTDLGIKFEDNALIPITGTESYTFSHTKLSKPMKISIDHESEDKKTFNITASDGSSVKVIQNGSTYSVKSIFCNVSGLSKSALIGASYCKR